MWGKNYGKEKNNWLSKKTKTKNKTAKQTQGKSISVTQGHRYVTASTDSHGN